MPFTPSTPTPPRAMPRLPTTTIAATHPGLAANLRLLCSFKPSISDVARALELNRSQLNKYLNGSSQPRPALLRRIGDHFGVELHELLMPPDEFAALMGVRSAARPEASRRLQAHLDRLLQEADPRGRQLVGSFFEVYHSMSMPGQLLRTLIVFELQDGVVVYKRLERVGAPGGRCRRHYRYQGIAMMLGDRIMLSDYECGLRIELTQTILYPDYSRSLSTLMGVKVGISANHQRTPCAARVLLERTPPGASLLANLRRCGLHGPDDDAIAPHIRQAVDNRVSGPHHFLAPTGA